MMEKLWTVLLVGLVTLLDPTNGFYHERRGQCLYRSRDLSDMIFIDSYIFNKIEYIRFNSTLGKYVGFTEFGIKNADRWNSDTAFLQREQGDVDAFCKHNAEIYYPHIIDKSVPPKIKLRSVKQASGGHPAMLMCSAYDFYPKTIDVYWLRDGKKVTSDVTSTEEMADGDWYYQIHSHLEYTPTSGEKISCVVEHVSSKEPIMYEWDGSLSESERNKVAIGASGLVLGIILSAAGFIYYKKKSSTPY